MSTAAAAELLVELEARHDRELRIRNGALILPPNLSARERARVAALRRELTHVVELRAFSRAGFALVQQGLAADSDRCTFVLEELARLIDDVGPAVARALQRHWAREWTRTQGTCPHCGSIHQGDR